MLSNKIIILAIFSSLFYLDICQVDFRSQINIKKLQSFVKCVSDKIEKSNIEDVPLDLVLSLLVRTPQQRDYKRLQELFTQNFDKISDCLGGTIPKMPDGTSVVDINSVFKEKYDWDHFISCLIDKVKNIDNSPFQKLIQYINEGNYINALREEFKLRNNGNLILKECMTSKMQELLNKNTNKDNK